MISAVISIKSENKNGYFLKTKKKKESGALNKPN